MNILRCIFAVLFLLFSATSVSAEVWTAYQYPNNNLQHRNNSVLDENDNFVAVIRNGKVIRVTVTGPPTNPQFTFTYFCLVSELPMHGITLVYRSLLK